MKSDERASGRGKWERGAGRDRARERRSAIHSKIVMYPKFVGFCSLAILTTSFARDLHSIQNFAENRL